MVRNIVAGVWSEGYFIWVGQEYCNSTVTVDEYRVTRYVCLDWSLMVEDPVEGVVGWQGTRGGEVKGANDHS